MHINPETLKVRRDKLGLPQSELAKRSCVNQKTISNIESGKRGNVRTLTAKSLAQALDCKPEDLAKPPKADAENELRDAGYRPLNTYLRGDTALAYALVCDRYRVGPQALIEAAPLMFTLLAEKSLAERRARVAETEAALAALNPPGHLDEIRVGLGRIDGALGDEAASIAAHDLFGARLLDDRTALAPAFEPEDTNPFVESLRALAAEVCDAGVVDPHEIRPDSVHDGMPEYGLMEEALERFTGGDFVAREALRRGHARLVEIPEELRGADQTQARAEWLAAQFPPEERERLEGLRAALASIDLSAGPEEAAS